MASQRLKSVYSQFALPAVSSNQDSVRYGRSADEMSVPAGDAMRLNNHIYWKRRQPEPAKDI